MTVTKELEEFIEKTINNAQPEIYKRGIIIFQSKEIYLTQQDFNSNHFVIKVPGEQKPFYSIQINPFSFLGIHASCQCPYNDNGKTCKHLVAALFFLKKSYGLKVNVSRDILTENKKSQKTALLRSSWIPSANKIPERPKDYQWLNFSSNYYYLVVENIEYTNNRLIFKVSEYGRVFQVALYTQKNIFHTSCSCHKNVKNFCMHESTALAYLSAHCSPELVQQIDPKAVHQMKLDYLQKVLPQVDESRVDDYVKAEFDGEKLFINTYNKAEGFYDLEKVGNLLQNKIIQISGSEERISREFPFTHEKDQNESIYAFVLTFYEGYDVENVAFGLKLVSGKPNKNRTAIGSHLKEVEDVLDLMEKPDEDLLDIMMARQKYLNYFEGLAEHHLPSLFTHTQKLFTLLKGKILYYKFQSVFTYDTIRKSDLVLSEVMSSKASLHINVEEEDELFFKIEAYIELDDLQEIPMKDVSFVGNFIGVYNEKLFHISSLKDYHAIKVLQDLPVQRYLKNDFDKLYNTIVSPLQNDFKVSFKNMSKPIQTVIISPSKKQLYVSELSNFVIFTPEVLYKDGNLVNVLEDKKLWKKDDVGISELVRDNDYEKDFEELIRSLHPSFKSAGAQGFFHLTIKEMMKDYWFLSVFEKLRQSKVEVFGLKDLKNFKYSVYRPSVKVAVSSSKDWFDTTIELGYGSAKVSVNDLKKALAANQNFVKLDDGGYGILPDEWLYKFRKIFRAGKETDEKIRVSKLNFNLLNDFIDPSVNPEVFQELAVKKEKLKGFKGIKDTKMPEGLTAELRNYQKEGLNWLNFLDEFGWGGILADDMGLGKTLQVIAFLQLQKNKKKKQRTSLVVAPTSLLFNWKDELKKFAPQISFLLYHGNDRNLEAYKDYDLVITSYGTLANDLEKLKKINFNYVVLDESQAIKNVSSLRYKAACSLKTKNRLALTGTPVENNTMELFAQMNFVNPGFLFTINNFKDNYAKPIEQEKDFDRSQELKSRIAPFILRRTKKEVLTELPDKTEETLYCIMGDEQRKVYDAYRNKYRDHLLGLIERDGFNKSVIHVLDGLTKLRQICDAPQLLDTEGLACKDSIKINELIRHVEEKTGNHKILVFSQFVKMLKLIEDKMQAANIEYEYLDGRTPQKQREQKVKRFQTDSGCRVFLISLKAGGVGLNLTEADYVYIVDPWWNPAVENQAIDRCYRMGQKKNVTAYRMICKDTIEEKIFGLQLEKKALSDNLLDGGEGFTKQLTKEDIEVLFS